MKTGWQHTLVHKNKNQVCVLRFYSDARPCHISKALKLWVDNPDIEFDREDFADGMLRAGIAILSHPED